MRRSLIPLLGLILLAMLAGPARVAAGTGPTIVVNLFESRIHGTGTPSEPIRVQLLDADGVLVADRTVRVGKRGGFGAQVPPLHPAPGERVVVTQGELRRSLDVPDIRPLVDREADRITGHARPGAAVEIRVTRGPQCCSPNIRVQETVTAAPDGRYRLDLAGEVDLIGPNQVSVASRVGPHTVRASTTAPWLNVNHGTTLFQGLWDPARAFPIDLIAPDGTRRLRVRLSTDPWGGWFAGLWQDSDGIPVTPRPGDRIQRPGLPDLVVPHFRLTGDAEADIIRGRCIPDAEVSVWLRHSQPSTTTDAQGRFRLDLSAEDGFGPNGEWTVLCYWDEHDRYIAVGSF